MKPISRPSNLTLEYGKRDNQPHTDYLHIFKLQEDENILSITHEQEQPTYKLEYHYTNYVKIKMHYLRKSTSFVKMAWTLLYVMLLPEEY